MDETRAELEQNAELHRKKRRRVAIVAAVLLAVVFAICLACGLGMLAVSRHAKDVRSFTPIAAPPVVGEADPLFARVAAARVSVPVDGGCQAAIDGLKETLTAAGAADAAAFHEALRSALATLDLQPLRDVCQAVRYGGCTDDSFLAFRAYLVAMGRPTVDLARRDADALVASLPEESTCDSLLWVANAAHDEATRATRAPGALHDDLPRIEPTTRTHATPRGELRAKVPRTCARFSCSARDLLDD